MVRCGWCEKQAFIPGDLPPLATEACKNCGHQIMMPMQLRQFELRSKIASGGMGIVYRGWDTMLERMVAVKLMKKELLEDVKALESFGREARACARLNHTNIIHIYTFDEWEKERYLVMELADRGSLDNRIETLHKLPEVDVLDYGIKIAQALDMALGFLKVVRKSFLQLGRGGILGHLGECLDKRLLGPIDVLDLIEEKLLKFGSYVSLSGGCGFRGG